MTDVTSTHCNARYTSLAVMTADEWAWAKENRFPHGGMATAMGLFETEGTNFSCPVVLAYTDNDVLVGWGLLRGYLHVFVPEELRRRGIGRLIADAFVKHHGAHNMLFSTHDAASEKLYAPYVTAERPT